MTQAIVSGVWTKLVDHDVELFHQVGYNVTVEVVAGELVAPYGTECELRPLGGVYPPKFKAPISGWYRFGYRDDRYETTTRIELTLDDVVLADVRRIDTEQGPAYAFPEIAASSGQPLLTRAEHSLEVEWSDRG